MGEGNRLPHRSRPRGFVSASTENRLIRDLCLLYNTLPPLEQLCQQFVLRYFFSSGSFTTNGRKKKREGVTPPTRARFTAWDFGGQALLFQLQRTGEKPSTKKINEKAQSPILTSLFEVFFYDKNE